jgi:hypothetical protein
VRPTSLHGFYKAHSLSKGIVVTGINYSQRMLGAIACAPSSSRFCIYHVAAAFALLTLAYSSFP